MDRQGSWKVSGFRPPTVKFGHMCPNRGGGERRRVNNDTGTIGDFVLKEVFAQVNVTKVLGHVCMI